jgi:hypothetical protein
MWRFTTQKERRFGLKMSQPKPLTHLTLKQKAELRKEKRYDELCRTYEVDELSEMQFRYLEKGIRYQGIFDIETSDFDPEERFIICYDFIIRDILTGEEEHLQDHITKDDIKKAVKNNTFHFDYRLLETLSWNIKQCDQLVGHFSSKFDMPYFRSRCLLTRRPELIPEYGSIRYADTWRMMKQSMKAKRNTLKNFIRQTTGNDEKTFVDLKFWFKVWFGDNQDWKLSMDYIVDHCEKDVRMTLEGLKVAEKFNNIGMQLV